MFRRIPRVRARTLTAVAVGLGSAALAAAPASAAPSPTTLLSNSTSCAATATSQAFAQWGDTNQYKLVPGGSFAGSAPGWTLTGGAQVVAAGPSFDLTGDGSGALYLPAGATVQSPYVCVDGSEPTYRFVTLQGTGASSLTVQTVYQGLLGQQSLQAPLSISGVAATSAWSPTPQLQTAAAPAGVLSLSGGTAVMALRFTAGPGGAYIDDVFVDPRMRG